MTADHDLSPEAVERRLFNQERQDQVSHYDRGRAAGRDEAMAKTAPLIRKLSEKASALAAENARLRTENERMRAYMSSGSFYQEKDIDAMQDEIERLRAALAEARAALKPFSDATQWIDPEHADDYSPSWAVIFEAGDFRKAAAALS